MSRRDDCPFCDYTGPSKPLYQGRYGYIIEPLHPVTKGHLLVVPFSHVNDFAQNPTVSAWAMKLASWWAARHPGDWNLITSKGDAATQTVHHLHIHLLPRHKDDGLKLPWT